MDRQQILSYYAKWSEGRTQEECAKQWAYVCRLLSIIDEERSSDEYTDWHNYKKYVEEEKLLHKLFAIDNERRIAKQTPEALEKTGFDFNRWDGWYMENLSYALLTLGASREEILEIFKEELDIQEKFYMSGDLA